MLKQRVLTALIIAPIIILITLYAPTAVFGVVVALVLALAAWEWAGLAGLSGTPRYSYTATVLLVLGLLNRVLPSEPLISLAVISVGVIWWAAAFLFVMAFPLLSGFFQSHAIRALTGLLVLMPAHAGLLLLHQGDPRAALLVMVLVSFADIGAYFAGRAFGRRKLAPRVSPGKTWEGLGGAVALTLAIAFGAARLLAIPDAVLLGFLAVCLVTVLASVVGDLTESMFKRMAGAKDSGHLLPGHGGVLDRLDSLTAAAPVFALGLIWLKTAA
ncbi:MAG: phosphatidate cytidylyltransferase [Gammaproteobacteria bacterium]|nr:phosphatidate cytidylyltransferase [Gammaproteobacteria bacterium]